VPKSLRKRPLSFSKDAALIEVALPIRHICPQQAEPRRNVSDRLAGLFLQAGSSPWVARARVARKRRDINGNRPRDPHRGSKVTGAGRSRTEFPADLR
jgi:hypothetical protein